MALSNNTYCQVCDRFINKERWNKHLFSSRHLHREVNAYWPAYFPQRKLTRDEAMQLEKAFWEMIFGSVDVLPVYGFLKTYIMMITNMKGYVSIDPDDADADFRYDFRDIMIAQFKQDFYNKNFSLQDQDKRNISLQKRSEFWLNYVVVNKGAPKPDNVFEYDYNDDGFAFSFCGAKNDPELRALKEFLTINNSEKQ